MSSTSALPSPASTCICMLSLCSLSLPSVWGAMSLWLRPLRSMALATMVFGEHCRLCRGYQTLEVFNGAFTSICWGLEQWAVGARACGVHTLRVHFQCPGSIRGQLQRGMSWWRPEQAERVGANCRLTRSSGGTCVCAFLWLLSLIPGTWQHSARNQEGVCRYIAGEAKYRGT